MSTYVAVHFDVTGHDAEIWMALLSEWPFESFHEEDNRITGYLPVIEWNDSLKSFLDEHSNVHYNTYDIEHVKVQNWNAIWEQSFQPVAINQFCYIRAPFHSPAPPGFEHELIIAPKMAFGTGHHATTYMMIEAMSSLDFKNKRVLDFGCGTGILSVVAALEGADEVIGLDIQTEAIENSIEHAQLNGVEHQCTFIQGGFEIAGTQPFDIILANINTKIIIEYFDEMKALLVKGGYMLLSGIMTSDMQAIEQHLNVEGLLKVKENRRDDWVQLTFKVQPKVNLKN